MPPWVPTNLPPMVAQPYPTPAWPPAAPQRPGVVGVAAAMSVTASALWICALATAWLFAAAGQQALAAESDLDGQVRIILNRFSARLLDGLALPLFGLPALAFVAGFLLLSRRAWARFAYTALGLITVGWLGWWLRFDLGWWVAPSGYILLACAIVWTPAATRWYRHR